MAICYSLQAVTPSTLTNRTLFFGDNLDILQEKLPEESFDLIYLDPPFNSNRDYNVLFKEGKIDSSAQIRAFEDTWEWTPYTDSLFQELRSGNNTNVALLISSLFEFLHDGPMMAYLVNMAARLIPLQRVLKPTGSIYLHCDSTASHYIKILMDAIFGSSRFQNEIIWHYRRWTGESSRFLKMHDVLLFYTKEEKHTFNPLYTEYTEKSLLRKQHYHTRIKGDDVYVTSIDPNGVKENDVWIIPYLNSQSKERQGYPTQKPEALLERIIRASSNEGDWVLDPFCGCGTTVAVAEKLHRKWVGIDISMLAIKVIEKRMTEHFPGIKIAIDGIPMEYEAAANLAERDKFAFQDWAITLVGASPVLGETRKGADRGIDGVILFSESVNFDNPHPRLRKIIVQVKGGGTNRGDIAKLKGDMDRENAPMSIFVTLNEPTSEMKREAVLAGEYRYSNTVSFPKVQILSVRDYFEDKRVLLPSERINPFKAAKAKADQPSLI